MSVLMSKGFVRFARKAGLTRSGLMAAAGEVAAGNFDADLGGGVFKQRLARPGAGKSGGFRTIILFRAGGHSFFVHGFGKNEKANVSARELTALKKLADVVLNLSDGEIEQAVKAGEFVDLEDEGDEAQQA